MYFPRNIYLLETCTTQPVGVKRSSISGFLAVMLPSHICRITRNSRRSHLTFFQEASESIHDLVKRIQSRVTKTVESLQVTGFNFESMLSQQI